MPAADFDQAFRLLKSGRIAEARDVCRAALKNQPGHPQGLLLLASLEHRLGDAGAALQNLLKAAEPAIANPAFGIKVVQALQRTGHPREASSLLTRIPGDLPGRASLSAQLLWQGGEYAQALQQFATNLDSEPSVFEHHSRFARALLRTGDAGKAQGMISDSLVQFPASEELQRLNAVAALDLGRPDQALQSLLEFTASGMATAASHHLLQALQVRFSDRSLNEPGYPFDNEAQSAAWEGFHWLMQQNPELELFGTGTALLRHAVQLSMPSGAVIECGVFHGFSLGLLADWIEGEMHGFDSFEGLPEEWKAGEPAGSYSTGGRLPDLPERVRLHRGWFEDTLPDFAASLDQPIRLLHIDCDLYSSTRTVLSELGNHLQPGSILLFDDFLAYAGYREHEFRAAMEFFDRSEQDFRPVAAVTLGRSVAFRAGG